MTLLTHTCAVVKAGSLTDYGQSKPSWASGTTTTSNVACLIQPRNMIEQATGAVIGTHVAYLDYATAPATLKTFGAEKTHRLANWAVGGVTRDAGPFEIVEIVDAAGQGHHWQLILKRALG